MGNPSSDTRTVIVIVAVVGLLSCGCMCLPLGLLGLAVGLPAAVQVQKAAQAAADNEPPDPRWAVTPPELKPVFETPLAPPSIAPPTNAPPPITVAPEIAPPAPTPPPPARPARPARAASAGGLAGLSEQQRRSIYFSAAVQRRIVESMEAQRKKLLERGASTRLLEQMAQSIQDMNGQLDRLSERNKITRAELDQIIAEGDQQGWGGPRKK